MKKQSALGYAVLAILLVMVSAVAFAVPIEKTTAFWVAYVFTVIAIATQVAIWKVAFGREGTLKSKFFGFPLINIGTIYLVLQIITFIVFMAMPTLPTWNAVIVCILILGFAAIGMIATEVGWDEIERVEVKVQKKVFYIKELQAEIEVLVEREQDAAVKDALKQLAEKIQFSDPMSHEALAELERVITDKVKDLKTAIDKIAIIDEIASLLAERNKKCKLKK